MGLAQKLLLTFFLCSSILIPFGIEVVESSSQHHHHHCHHHVQNVEGGSLEKMFVFGDSYADTGNTRIPTEQPWKEPYGVTFPGKPTGRYSDGLVFTDFIARQLGLKSPIPYKLRKYFPSKLRYGMNFAFGGTGVFDTTIPYPNMTTQIDFFERLLKDSVFNPSDLQNAIALISVAGNDYDTYLSRGGSIKGFQRFVPQVINQLAVDIQRIYNLGVKKIFVSAMHPLGCLPRITVKNSFQQCDVSFRQAVAFHNILLQQAISKLINQTTHDDDSEASSKIVILDIHNAFSSILQEIQSQQDAKGSKFDNPMKPCCMGINQNYKCGSVDEKGNKMYTVCQDPKRFFFWDDAHPTQVGWEDATLALQSTLRKLQHTLANNEAKEANILGPCSGQEVM